MALNNSSTIDIKNSAMAKMFVIKTLFKFYVEEFQTSITT